MPRFNGFCVLLLRLALSAFALSVCSTAAADALDDVLERGTLRVGVAEFVPWTIRQASGELMGFEIDVANKIASDMGVKPEFKLYIWEDIIPALRKGDIDVIAGGMAITPARALLVNFSRPLAQSGVGLATNIRMTSEIETIEQLNDPKITITFVKKTMASDLAKSLFGEAKLKEYPSQDLAEKELIEGRAHAYLADMTAARFLALKHSDVIDFPLAEPLIASREAMAVKKGEQELLNFLNAWVTARQADKWLPTTHDYWFGTLDWSRSEGQ
jgi:polar amino acid transport system substrate-binding protein